MRNRVYEFGEKYYTEEPRKGKCPEGYDYVKVIILKKEHL